MRAAGKRASTAEAFADTPACAMRAFGSGVGSRGHLQRKPLSSQGTATLIGLHPRRSAIRRVPFRPRHHVFARPCALAVKAFAARDGCGGKIGFCQRILQPHTPAHPTAEVTLRPLNWLTPSILTDCSDPGAERHLSCRTCWRRPRRCGGTSLCSRRRRAAP